MHSSKYLFLVFFNNRNSETTRTGGEPSFEWGREINHSTRRRSQAIQTPQCQPPQNPNQKGKKDTHSNVPSISQQHTPLLSIVPLTHSLPLRASPRLLLLVHEPIDRPVLRVDDDLVAVLDERDGPAEEGLGHDVSDDEAARGSGEPAVRDEGRLASQARTDQGRCRAQHLDCSE